MFTIQELIAICGVAIAIVSIVASVAISYYLNKKTLEQSKKNLEAQLLHVDRKKALFELSKIVRMSKRGELRENMFKFIHSTEGQYLPEETVKLVYNKITEIDSFIRKKSPHKEPEPSEEEILEWGMEDYYREVLTMSPTERFERELNEKISSLKSEILSEAHKKLKRPV